MQSAIVTGASAGIGLECAKILLKNNYQVFGGARRVEKMQQALQHDNFHPLSLDICNEDSIDQFLNAVKAKSPNINTLINNAGIALGVDPIHQGNPQDWQKVIDTNVMGLLRFTRKVLPIFVQQNGGDVINIGSIAGHFSYAGGGVYAGTKHMVKAINQAMRLELNGTKIRVCSVSPGLVETEFSVVRLGSQEKADQVYKDMEPLTPQDIAECVEFCLNRPKHVNIDDIIIMPTHQASVYKVHRKTN